MQTTVPATTAGTTTPVTAPVSRALDQVLRLYIHDCNEELALALHLQTGWPCYAVHDATTPPCSWGIDYWHFSVRTPDGRFFSALGPLEEQELIDYWAGQWKDPSISDNGRVVPCQPQLTGTGFADLDAIITQMYGDPKVLQPHVIQMADTLLRAFGLIE